MRATKAPCLLAVLFLLSACISGVKEPDTYTDRAGRTTFIETDHEQCVRSCNDTYSRCMDSKAAQDNRGLTGGGTGGIIGPPGMFGASADCRNDLQSCLPGCQGR